MELLLGLALSTHLNFLGDYNEVHPHIRLESERFAVGSYYNSMDRISLYGGYNYKFDNNIFVEGGIVSGYTELSSSIVPYVRAGMKLDNGLSVFATPSAEVIDDDINYGVVVGIEFMTNIFSK